MQAKAIGNIDFADFSAISDSKLQNSWPGSCVLELAELLKLSLMHSRLPWNGGCLQSEPEKGRIAVRKRDKSSEGKCRARLSSRVVILKVVHRAIWCIRSASWQNDRECRATYGGDSLQIPHELCSRRLRHRVSKSQGVELKRCTCLSM